MAWKDPSKYILFLKNKNDQIMSGRDKNEEPKWVENHRWYLVIGLVIIVVSFGLCFLIYFLKYTELFKEAEWFKNLVPDDSAVRALVYFLLGMLGASSYAAIFYARDCNRYFSEKKTPPSYVDVIGYVIHIFGGGITGIILLLLVRAGFLASAPENATFNESFAIVIALLGGIQSEGVKATLFRIGRNIMQTHGNEQEKK